MFKITTVLLVITMALFTTSVYAKNPIHKDTGLPLGSQVPEIAAIDTKRNPQTIKQLSGKKGLILILFRSADWCPYCKKHLAEINEWNSKFKALGYGIAAISYDSVETLKIFSEKANLQYQLLADQDNKTIKSFKVLNQKYKPGDDNYGIPYPGVMIIDAEEKLIYKYFYKGYKRRVQMKNIYQALTK